MDCLRLDGTSHPGQSKGAQAQPDVTQCDVEVLTTHDQVDRDQEQQPHTGEVRTGFRPAGDDHQRNDDFHCAGRHHELMSMASERTLRHRPQILVPMGEQVEKLVEPGDKWPEEKGKPQRSPRSIHRIAH